MLKIDSLSMIDADKLDFLLGNISFATAILGLFTRGAADIVNSIVSIAATESSGIVGFRGTQNQITTLKNKWYDPTVTTVVRAERDVKILQDMEFFVID